jgi:2-polyprenyl-3-methyl-5-hydroxy-6-metoxy-1,4-benzoquinol methylase
MKAVLNRIKRIINSRILKKWSNTSVKSAIWDKEFASGQWASLDHTTEDIIYQYLDKYSNNGSILDLGCGAGNTGNELDEKTYHHYTGVDISKEATQKAIIRSKANHRNNKNEYFASDIQTYTPGKQYDIILFRESIFYVPVNKIKNMLDGYSPHLKENGNFIVRMCDRYKYGRIVKLIRRHYTVIEEYLENQNRSIILVFR